MEEVSEVSHKMNPSDDLDVDVSLHSEAKLTSLVVPFDGDSDIENENGYQTVQSEMPDCESDKDPTLMDSLKSDEGADSSRLPVTVFSRNLFKATNRIKASYTSVSSFGDLESCDDDVHETSIISSAKATPSLTGVSGRSEYSSGEDPNDDCTDRMNNSMSECDDPVKISDGAGDGVGAGAGDRTGNNIAGDVACGGPGVYGSSSFGDGNLSSNGSILPKSQRTATSKGKPSVRKGTADDELPWWRVIIQREWSFEDFGGMLFILSLGLGLTVLLCLILTEELNSSSHRGCSDLGMKDSPTAHVLPVNSNMSFLAIGDWGGNDREPYYTQDQLDNAAGMDLVAGRLKAQFVLGLGDNFYTTGVWDPRNHRFQDTFENVYTGENLQVNWYMTPGNHDYYGNVCAQMAYSDASERWQFPSKYFTNSFTSADGAVTTDVLMIDTVRLHNMSPFEGDRDFRNPFPEVLQREWESIWGWIEEQLKRSTAQYLFVGGHHPVFSVCEHGASETMFKMLKPLLEQYGAHYMFGHDHCLQHAAEKGSNYYLIGTGKHCCDNAIHLNQAPLKDIKFYIASDNAPNSFKAGFTAFTMTPHSMTAVFYDQDGNVLYEAEPVPPRFGSAP